MCVCVVRVGGGGGGYSETLKLGLYVKFHWGGILKLLKLDSLSNFILGGYSETLKIGLSVKFHFFWGGGVF